MKILFVGDSHGDRGFFTQVMKTAIEVEADAVFQLGDFGYWPADKGGQRFLKHVKELAREYEMPVYWLEGNHEDQDALTDWCTIDRPPRKDGFIETSTNVFYSPRGHVWEWDGLKFMSMGGAYSIDRNYRVKYVSWFPREVSSKEEIAEASTKGPVDFLLCHDAPTGVPTLEMAFVHGPLRPIPESHDHRTNIRDLMEAVKPKVLIHGHYHHRYTDFLTEVWAKVKITGLAHNDFGVNSACMLIDTKDYHD